MQQRLWPGWAYLLSFVFLALIVTVTLTYQSRCRRGNTCCSIWLKSRDCGRQASRVMVIVTIPYFNLVRTI